MTPDQIFSIVNLIALSAWILLATLPGRRVVNSVAGAIVPALLAIVYIAIIAVQWISSSGGFSTLRDVATLFSNPWLLLAGWTHYLAFDLLIGSWEVRDARERAIPHLLVLPCLVLTFLFGPAGWLAYLTLRSGFRRNTATADRAQRAHLAHETRGGDPAFTPSRIKRAAGTRLPPHRPGLDIFRYRNI